MVFADGQRLELAEDSGRRREDQLARARVPCGFQHTQRAQHVDFSTPYIKLQQQLLVRADETRFASPDELKALADFKVGAQPGTTNYDLAVELFGEDNIVAFDQYGLIVQALLNDDIDATVMDNVAGEGYIGANPDKLKLVGDPLTSEELGFVFPKGSDLLEPINRVLAEMEADPGLQVPFAETDAVQMLKEIMDERAAKASSRF